MEGHTSSIPSNLRKTPPLCFSNLAYQKESTLREHSVSFTVPCLKQKRSWIAAIHRIPHHLRSAPRNANSYPCPKEDAWRVLSRKYKDSIMWGAKIAKERLPTQFFEMFDSFLEGYKKEFIAQKKIGNVFGGVLPAISRCRSTQ